MKRYNLTTAIILVLLFNMPTQGAANLLFAEPIANVIYASANPQRQGNDEDDGWLSNRGNANDTYKSGFESNYNGTYQRQQYNYSNGGNGYLENRNQTAPSYEYNQPIEFTKSNNITNGGGAINFSGNASNIPVFNEPVTAGVKNSGNFGAVTAIEPPKRRDVTPDNSPTLPGDPDVPVDGGILTLLAAGAAFGFRKKLMHQVKSNNK